MPHVAIGPFVLIRFPFVLISVGSMQDPEAPNC